MNLKDDNDSSEKGMYTQAGTPQFLVAQHN